MRFRCEIVVLEDVERDPVGKHMDFAVVPRIGDGIVGFGVVVEVNHIPVETNENYTPSVSLYVRREAKNARST